MVNEPSLALKKYILAIFVVGNMKVIAMPTSRWELWLQVMYWGVMM